ncbi:hypothetical protein VIBNISOn1_p0167 [Vibrio nigripulchritudo SOn1]|uniref:Uncharacterized protein n=1 Tax=Vibrio nigripulchritudo SOn1 TaxID=1238450 RepID=A0AAV2VZX3_9VIBR|nr:hypothetical protein VIBNISOn1_p0167 [Vibrio nigripulchritudo SOn1]
MKDKQYENGYEHRKTIEFQVKSEVAVLNIGLMSSRTQCLILMPGVQVGTTLG